VEALACGAVRGRYLGAVKCVHIAESKYDEICSIYSMALVAYIFCEDLESLSLSWRLSCDKNRKIFTSVLCCVDILHLFPTPPNILAFNLITRTKTMKHTQLPHPPAGFTAKKAKILSQLSTPEADYTDASPKGSVDAGIRDLIDEINARDGLVTTSSCAGRVSVFVEGSKTPRGPDVETDRSKPASAVGGKGGGGTWLFVSHDPVDGEVLRTDGDVARLFGFDEDNNGGRVGMRLIHFKFEPMVSFC
jgi:hypothetical protein